MTVQDSEGRWLNATPAVKLEVISGPGVFPTGKSIEFKPAGQSDIAIRNGKAAIEFRSYYAGTTVIRATSTGLDPADIYRSSKAASGFVKIGTVTSAVYKDKKVKAGQTWYYKVAALGASAAANSVQSSAIKVRLLKAPSITAKSRTAGKVTISWKAVTGAKGYKIYTAMKKSGKYKAKLTVKKGTRKKGTLKLKRGRTYYIKVKAYTTFGKKRVLSPFSKPRKVTVR